MAIYTARRVIGEIRIASGIEEGIAPQSQQDAPHPKCDQKQADGQFRPFFFLESCPTPKIDNKISTRLAKI